MSKFYGWAIDRDYLTSDDDDFPARVGFGQTEEEAKADNAAASLYSNSITIATELSVNDVMSPVRFRLLDDDGEVYYGGAVSQEWLTDSGAGDGFNIDRWGEADAGATQSQFRASDLPSSMVERHRKIGATTKAGGTEWVILYG